MLELINSGVSIEVVRRRLGHASAGTTQACTLLAGTVAGTEIRAVARDLPVPLDLRLRDRHHLAEHDRAARADLLRPPMTSADRFPPPSGLPFFSGDASSSSAQRPPSRPRRARHTTGQGKKKAREAPAKK